MPCRRSNLLREQSIEVFLHSLADLDVVTRSRNVRSIGERPVSSMWTIPNDDYFQPAGSVFDALTKGTQFPSLPLSSAVPRRIVKDLRGEGLPWTKAEYLEE